MAQRTLRIVYPFSLKKEYTKKEVTYHELRVIFDVDDMRSYHR
jgi:hypothetical protein